MMFWLCIIAAFVAGFVISPLAIEAVCQWIGID
jgi:hypothetical protein